MNRKGEISMLAGILGSLFVLIVVAVVAGMLNGSLGDFFQLGEEYCEVSEATTTEMAERLTKDLNAGNFDRARSYYDGVVEPCFGPMDIPFNEDSQRVDLFCESEFQNSDHRDLIGFRDKSCS